jgi:hypothetical protein
MNRFFTAIAGLFVALYGLLALFQPGYYSDRFARYIRFGEHHELVGCMIILVSFGLFYVTFKIPRA